MVFDYLPVVPKVSIVILNWNGLKDTLTCLESVMVNEYPNFDIYLVDNGSTDGSRDQFLELAKHNPKIRLIFNSENLGFSKGCNLAIKKALNKDADYILLLNNDTRVKPDFLSHLVRSAARHKKAGMVGPKVYYEGKENVLYCAGAQVIKSLGQPFLRGLGQLDQGQFEREEAVGFISGCCLLVKREVIEKIGVLDEDYFAFFEDLDWNIRAREAGYESIYVPSSVIWHKGSGTIGFRSPSYYFLHSRNRILFARKHTGFFSFLFLFIPYFVMYRYFRAILSLAWHKRWGQVMAIHHGILSAIMNDQRYFKQYIG